jgi:hypothetical protein
MVAVHMKKQVDLSMDVDEACVLPALLLRTVSLPFGTQRLIFASGSMNQAPRRSATGSGLEFIIANLVERRHGLGNSETPASVPWKPSASKPELGTVGCGHPMMANLICDFSAHRTRELSCEAVFLLF